MRFFALLVLLLLAGCAAPADEVVLWNDFGYSWEILNHRLALLRAGAAPGDEEGVVEAELGLSGGPFGDIDDPNYDLAWTTVTSRRLQATYGSTDLRVGPDGRATARESIPLGDLAAANVYAVALAGIDFVTDVEQEPDYPVDDYDPAYGWTVQGFGVAVGMPEIVDDALSFDVSAHFKGGPLDRDDMNAAMPFATVGATVRWVVLTVSSGALITEPFEVSAYYAVGGQVNTPHPPIDESLRQLTLVGAPGLAVGVPVLRAWDFELNRSLDEEGRYLRAFSAGIEEFDYEPATGEASVLVDAFASIESLIQEGDLEVDFTAEIGLLQIDDPKAIVTEGSLSGLSEETGVFDQLVTP